MGLNAHKILQLPSMPAASSSYPRGPYRFLDCEYLIVTYEVAIVADLTLPYGRVLHDFLAGAPAAPTAN